jgi:pimeloyl-ACP methyl ester carboxylesterase
LRSEARFSIEQCADLAAGVLEALDVAQAFVVGYSMGGPVALRLWERHPDQVAALVLGATALRFNESWYDRVSWRFIAAFEWLLRTTDDEWFIRRVIREVIEQDDSIQRWQGWLFGELERGNPRDVRDAGVALSRFDATGFADRIDVPRAVIVTDHDQLVPPRRQRRMAAALRAPAFVIHADHNVPLVRAEPFVAALQAALDEVEAQAGLEPTHQLT